ncbi:MAG: hypothetical protein ABIR56_18805 [Polaromonas sp.]
MTFTASDGFMLTPAGALHAFAGKTPDLSEFALQALLTGERSLDLAAWSATDSQAPAVLAVALENGWGAAAAPSPAGARCAAG